MKFFIVLLAIFALAHADEEWKPNTGAEVLEIRTACLKEHPLSEESANKLKNFEYVDEEDLRKYLLCSLVKMGLFCEHEGFHAERAAKQFPVGVDEAEVLEIAKGCFDKNEQGSSADVWAYRGHTCFMSSKIGDKVKAFITKKREEAQKSA